LSLVWAFHLDLLELLHRRLLEIFLPLRLETLAPSRILSNSISQNSPKPLKSLAKSLRYKALSFWFYTMPRSSPKHVNLEPKIETSAQSN
jgi:hypothetical protein